MVELLPRISFAANGACTGPAPANPCIPGGGLKNSDCRLEWLVTPSPATNSQGIPASTAVCYEGDPRCDLDADLTNHSCTMRVAACINNTDPRLPQCTPSAIESFEVVSPRPSSTDPADVANVAVLEATLGSGGFGTTVRRGTRVVSAGTRNATPNACGTAPSIIVPQQRTRTGAFQAGSKTLTLQVTAYPNGVDRDSLTLQCRLSTCGNHIVESYEDCDDGNRVAGDGCDPGCRLELPPEHALLTLRIRNDTGRILTADISGARLSGPSSTSAALTYGPTTRSIPPGGTDVALETALAPGTWLHHLTAAGTGQLQHQQSLVVSDAVHPNVVEWALAGTVLTVNRPDDSGDGVCDATCSLRDAFQTAGAASPPVLIRFDHAAFAGAVAAIQVTNNAALLLRGARTVIDGTDAAGNPSPLAEFSGRVYPTIITLRAPNANPQPSSCPCSESPGGTIRVQAEGVRLQGLSIRRQLAPQGQICCGDQDLVAFDAGSRDSQIDTCQLDGGAAAISDATVPSGQTRPATGKDCIDADSTGATSAQPVRIDNSEVRFCHDRAVKSRKGVVHIEHSWIHHNLRGGAFAQSPGAGESERGVVEAVGNLVEHNGQNCPTGDPTACGAQEVVTRADASELSAQGPLTDLRAIDNIVREGTLHGLYFQDQSSGAVVDDYVCGIDGSSGGKGILIEKLQGNVADVTVRGSAFVYNDDAGAKLDGQIAADFGTDGGTRAGNNVFAANGTSVRRNLVNVLDAPPPIIAAQGNQWEHCYSGSTAPDACAVAAISDNDTNNSVGTQDRVDVRNPKPHQGTGTVRITRVSPAKVTQGGLVWITGSGFDAVSGHTGSGSGQCRTLASRNACNPVRGTCVEFLVNGEWTEALDVVAITPTAVAVRAPATCAAPMMVRVRRTTRTGAVIASAPAAFCFNEP